MRIAIVVNDNFTVWHFFRGLISELVSRGCVVFVICPHGDYSERIEKLGATHVAVHFERFLDPLADIRTLSQLIRTMWRLRVNLACNITAKPIVFGGMAARLAGVPRVIGMIEGLGYGFETAGSWKRRMLRWMIGRLYWIGCRVSDRVGFANPDDRALFVSEGILPAEKAVAFRSMIGVNVREYAADAVDAEQVKAVTRELDLLPGQLLVTMVVARQCWSKGVREFADAAAAIQGRFPDVRFLLVGPPDPKSPEAVPDTFLRERLGPRFHWITFSHHVREILHVSDVVVLPSYYREGVPVVLLEALAMGKPIVTTDNVGCRETVDADRNGFLIPVKDSAALTAALAKLVLDEQLRARFGRESRAIAEQHFDQRIVIERLLAMWGIDQYTMGRPHEAHG